MTKTSNQDDVEGAETSRPPAESVYTYTTAGIGERKGHVPVWLWLVAISLTIWGIYYLYTYWNPPAASP
jgi:hypothetical protein